MLKKFCFILATKGFCIAFLFVFCLSSQSGYAQNPSKQDVSQIITLEAGKVIEREFTNGAERNHDYQIALSAAQYAKIIVEQHGIDVSARLLSADGKPIINSDSDPRREGRETLEFTVRNPSVLTITVSAKQNNTTGHYKIRIEEIRAANDKDYSLSEARQLNFEATILWLSYKYDEALPLARQALAIREKELNASDPDIAVSLTTLANIDSDKGDYDNSEPLYLQAIAIRERTFGKDDFSLSPVLNNLGLLYKLKGDYVKAESVFRRTLEIREKNLEPAHLLIANILNNLAGLKRITGDRDKAAEYYRRALEIRENALPPDSPDIAQSLMNLANLYSDIPTSAPLYLRALNIREKTYGADSPYVAETLYNLAVLYNEAGDDIEAEPLAKRALAIDANSLGAEHPMTAYTTDLLATIYKNTGDYAQSATLFQRAIEIKEKTQGTNHPDLSDAYSSLSQVYAFKNDINQAALMQARANSILEFNLALNLTIGSEKQKLEYLETLDGFFSRTLRLNFQFAPDSEAAANQGAEIILRRKGRVLDAVAENINALRRRSNEQDRLLLDNLDKINKQIAEFILNSADNSDEFKTKIKTLTDERDELEDKISRRANGFYEKTQPVTLSEIQSLIPQKAALVEFAVYDAVTNKSLANIAKPPIEKHYAVYILHNQELAGLDLGNAEQIDEAIYSLRQALRDPKNRDVQTFARAVDKKVMQPIRALLGDSKQLLISPDGELNLIPFEALVDENNHYLIENYSFTYLTSGRDLLRMQKTHESRSKALIIANPSFGEPPEQTIAVNKPVKTPRRSKRQSIVATRNMSDTYFAPLGGTLQEARSIQMLFPDAEFLTGTQATESALKQAAAPRILHIATHGFFLQDAGNSADNSTSANRTNSSVTENKIENPLLRSGLALAGANQLSSGDDDGVLTALEASGLNLWGTKLVVLSACDTGIGEVKNGEGVYGLRRAFTLAGAESLVMSLWSVSDYTTRELMTNYYKNLKQGMGRGAALREVQLEMMKRKGREHPFYWAAFIESGEWGNLDGKR